MHTKEFEKLAFGNRGLMMFTLIPYTLLDKSCLVPRKKHLGFFSNTSKMALS